MANGDAQSTNGTRYPDPSLLTTEALTREIGHLKDLLGARFDAGDRAVKLLQEITDRFPLLVKAEISHSQELTNEKFSSVATRFSDNKVAVDDALKGVTLAGVETKSAITKQIDGIVDRINDVKDRLIGIESHAKGLGDGWGYLVGAGGVVAAIVMAVTLAIRLSTGH
jgi:hypothetical protein